METLDQQERVEVVFDIKKQAVEKLNEKSLEEIKKKFILQLKDGNTFPTIMRQNGISNYYDYITYDNANPYSLFPSLFKQLETGVDSHGKMTYMNRKKDISNRNISLFFIEQAFIKEGVYFFYTSDGQILTANKSDFDTYGIYAPSLNFYGRQGNSGDVRGKIGRNVYINGLRSETNGDGFVHFYGLVDGMHKLDIPGDKAFQIKQGSIMVSDGGMLYEYTVSDSGYKKLGALSTTYKGITQMVVDYNRNFLFIVNETDEGSTLHIALYNDFIEKHEINEVYAIKNVKEVCGVVPKRGLVCLMNDGSLQYYRNTLGDFKSNFFKDNDDGCPKGKLIYPKEQDITIVTDSGKTELLKGLEDGSISIDFDEDVVDETDKIDNDIINQIWKIEIPGKGISLRDLFESAKDEESILHVLKIFQKIKQLPQIVKYEGITKDIEKEITNKKNQIILSAIYSDLGDISEELSGEADAMALFTIKDKLKNIQKKRRKLAVGAVEQDKQLKQLLEIVDQKITEYQESHKDEIEQEIEDNLVKIEEILNNIDNPIDVSSVLESEIYKTTLEMILSLDENSQNIYHKKLNDLRGNRLKQIKDLSRQEKEKEQQIIENKKREIETNIEQIKEILEELDDISTVEQYEQNDLMVNEIRKQLGELPSADAQKLDLKLKRIFTDRIFALRLGESEAKGVVQNLDSYGIDTALYYDEDGSEQVEWKIEGKERPDGKISLIVKLTNGETHEYDKSLSLKSEYAGVRIRGKKIKFDMTEDEFYDFQSLLYEWKEENKRQEYYDLIKKLRLLPKVENEEPDGEKKVLLQKISDIRKKYGDIIYTEHLISRLIKQQKLNPRSKVPPFDPEYIVLDEEREVLRQLSVKLVDQKKNGGIEILEGGPGLGKTVMCEFLAQVTNREIIRVQCSKMDPSDMFFAPTLKKGETSREPADWIKLMQKPGTIILFDEIDKLNDQCFERLHSLFDRSKSVYDPQLGKIKANPDCLFLGTRNSYDRMPNPITSRGRILQINYPGELNESYKISKYADSSILKKLSYEEFSGLYEKFITRGEASPNNPNEKKIYNLIININHLLNIFTELRKQYDSDEPFAYELSYRDARQIFVDYNGGMDFKGALENVLVPKARAAVVDKDEKLEQENMVRRAIDMEMR